MVFQHFQGATIYTEANHCIPNVTWVLSPDLEIMSPNVAKNNMFTISVNEQFRYLVKLIMLSTTAMSISVSIFNPFDFRAEGYCRCVRLPVHPSVYS